MDFSTTERNGFKAAFLMFWLSYKSNTRSEDELKDAAERLLKGCEEHYRAGVTRIARIGGVIPPDDAEDFKYRALSLLDLPDSETFKQACSDLVHDYPKTKDWMAWWARDANAKLLFRSERAMESKLAETLPDTNNAEESMHWKIYRAVGKFHLLIAGLVALYAFAEHYFKLYKAALGEYYQCSGFKM